MCRVYFFFTTLFLLAGNAFAQCQIVNADLTKGAPKDKRFTINGGAWKNGWNVTGELDRIQIDAGYEIKNGYFEVVVARKGGIMFTERNWMGLFACDTMNQCPGGYARAGAELYGFSKAEIFAANQTPTICEKKFGEYADWVLDDKTEHTVRAQIRNGVMTWTSKVGDKQGQTACGDAAQPVTHFRYATVGGILTEKRGWHHGSLVGLRVLRLKLVDDDKPPHVEDKSYFSQANNQEIKIKVYTPPGYATSNARYPVVYNLHGGGGSPARQWERVGATLVDAMENKRVRPMIYVFAEGLGNTLFVNTAGTKLQVETTVIKELIPFIDKHYRTIAAREGRAIDGFSMGGFGAMHFAFKYPELFSSVTAYGGALLTYDTLSARDKKENFGDSRDYFNEHNPWTWAEKNATQIRELVKVRMVIGTKDWLYERNREFKAHLDKLKIPVSYQEIEGEEHCTKCLYEKAGLESLKLIAEAFTLPGQGNLQDREYFSRAMQRTMRYKIYTPPDYDAGKQRFPVVYNLHGAGGGTPDRQWARAHEVIVDAMETRKVRPMIYVFVDGLGSTMWADAMDGKRLTATTFINELIPHVDATYRTIASKRGRAIDGFSMGGFGALMFSMKHPDLFSSAVSYGAAVVTFEALSKGIKRDAFADNAEHWAKFDPRVWLARNADAVRKGVRVRMVCGTKDDLYAANLDFKALLEKQNIPLSWQAVEGVAHDTTGLYRAVGLASLQFIERGFTGTTNQPQRSRAK